MARKKWDVYRYGWFESDGKRWRDAYTHKHPARWAVVTEHGKNGVDTDAIKAEVDAAYGYRGGTNRPYAYAYGFDLIATVSTRKEAIRLAMLYIAIYEAIDGLQPARFHAIRERAGLKDFAAMVDPANRAIVRRANANFVDQLEYTEYFELDQPFYTDGRRACAENKPLPTSYGYPQAS